jgi:hypothetical protein
LKTSGLDTSNDSSIEFQRSCSVELWLINQDSDFLRPDSALQSAGQQMHICWDYDRSMVDDGGVPDWVRPLISSSLLSLGAATFSVWSHPTLCGSSQDTRAWNVRTPLLHRLRYWVLEDRSPGVRTIHQLCTTNSDLLQEGIDWCEKFSGVVVVAREPLDERTWTWNELREFSAGIVDDRSGVVLNRDPLAIVIPGTDAEHLWMWCAHEVLARFQQVLSLSCRNANLPFRIANSSSVV